MIAKSPTLRWRASWQLALRGTSCQLVRHKQRAFVQHGIEAEQAGSLLYGGFLLYGAPHVNIGKPHPRLFFLPNPQESNRVRQRLGGELRPLLCVPEVESTMVGVRGE
jgi:hypothetical protein